MTIRIIGAVLGLVGAPPAFAQEQAGPPALAGWQRIAHALEAPASAPEAEPGASDQRPIDLSSRLTDINRRRIALTGYGSGVLLAWAVGNIAVGVVGNVTADDEQTRAFHQGNWGWNVVNLVIGGIGVYNAMTADPASFDYDKTRGAVNGARLAFVINGVLDCVYMGTGAWLWERGLRTDEPIMTGWGQALVLQGGFLLAFDLVMWGLSLGLVSDVDEIPVKLVPTHEGMALVGRF